MLSVKLDTGFNIEVEFPVASFFKRSVAWTIDLLVCWLLVKSLASISGTESFFVWTNVWETKGLLISLPALFYHLICELSLNGRSIGKLAMNCKVITAEGGQPTIGQYLIRWVFRGIDFPWWIVVAASMNVIPWWTILISFSGLICVLRSPKSQRIGDVIAGTILIDLKNQTSWQDTVFTELETSYQPQYPQVMQLSDRDINTLKSIIEIARKRRNQELSQRIADRIVAKTNIVTDQEPFDFLETLLKDYNYYAQGLEGAGQKR